MRRLTLAITALLLVAPLASAGTVESQLDPAFAAEVQDRLYRVYNDSGSSIAINKLVYISGVDASTPAFEISLADADVSGAKAKFITTQAIANGSYCTGTSTSPCITKQTTLLSQNTNGLSVGAAEYLSATAGAYTATAPTAANSIQQIVGRVRVVSSTVGVIDIDLEANDDLVKIGTNELQAGALTADELSVAVRNETGGTLTAPYVVYTSSWNETEGKFLITGADVDAGNSLPACVLLSNLATNTNGTCYIAGRMASLNTSGASAVGAAVYGSATAGGWTLTAPTASNAVSVIIGRVAIKNATTGAIEFDFLNAQVDAIGSNELQADSVTNTILANMTRGTVKVGGASNVPTDLDAKTDKQILVGDGTDIASVAVSGDVALANTGAVTIQPVAVEPTMEGLTCTNNSGGDYAAGDFVYFNSHTGTVLNCALADADVAGADAQYVVTSACTNGSACVVARSALITSVDTSAVGAVGDPLYLTVTGTTTNTWSAAAPTGADDRVQIVARVTIDNATGAFLADLRSLPTLSIATNEITDGGIATADIGDDQVTNDKLANMTRGTCKVGGTSNAPTDLDCNDASKILVGDATDINSVSLSGLIDISTAGKMTLDARFKQFNFRDPANILNNALALVTAGAGETEVMSYPEGTLMMYLEEQVGAPTITDVAQTVTAYGIDFGLDNTDNDGAQISPQIATGGESFTGQTDAFYVKIQFRVEDASGTDPLCLCVVTPQAYGDIDAVADVANYGAAGEEVACLCTGTGAGTDPAVIHQISATNGGGIQNNAFTTSDYQCADATTYTWEIDVAASGAFTVKVDGNNPGGGGAALTLTADEFFPLIIHDSSSDVNANFYLSLFEWGLQ